MATQTQIQANRQNAQKSTGPKNPEGKSAVAQNALKHGLTARRDVVFTENQEDFDLHREALLEDLAPQGQMEMILADRIVSLSWRLKRADLIQHQTIDSMHTRDEAAVHAVHSTANFLKGLGRPVPETSATDPALALGHIALRDFAEEKVLDQILIYERRIENSLYKTTVELRKLKNTHRLTPGPVPGAQIGTNR